MPQIEGDHRGGVGKGAWGREGLFVDWLAGWVAGWLVGWLAGWLVGWLVSVQQAVLERPPGSGTLVGRGGTHQQCVLAA